MNSYTRLPEDCKTINDIVVHAVNTGMFRGCSVDKKESSAVIQTNMFSRYFYRYLNNNKQNRKFYNIGINTKIFFVNKLLEKHFPGKALIGYNSDIAIAVALMSITGHEITMDHVKGLIDKYKGTSYSLNRKFFQMECHFKFAWPPRDVGTFDCNTAGIVSDPVSRELFAKLKMSVANVNNTAGDVLSPDETEVLDILLDMDGYASDKSGISASETEVIDILLDMDGYASDKSGISASETEVLDILLNMDFHASKKRIIQFGGEGSVFKPYKKPCV